MDEAGLLSGRDAAEAALAAIRSRWRLVALLTIAAPLIAIALNATQRSWQASLQLGFTPLTQSAALAEAGIAAQPAPTGADLLGDSLMQTVARQVDGFDGPGAIRERLQVDQADDRTATLTASAPTRDQAVALANAWGQAVVAARNALLAQQFDAARRALGGQRTAANAAQRKLIDQSLIRLDAARASVQPDTGVMRGASAAPVGATRFNEVLALVLGLGLGVGAALALAVLDRRARTPAAVAAAHRTRLLGVLPGRNGSGPGLGEPAVEAASRVEARLALAAEGEMSPLLVTAARGTSATHEAALALVAAYAQGGRRAALLIWNGPEAVERAQEALADGGHGRRRPTVAAIEGTWEQVSARVAKLAGTHDVVVIDAPAALEQPDVLLATQSVATWLLCGAVGEVRGDDGEQLHQEIAGLARPPAGVVVSGRSPG